MFINKKISEIITILIDYKKISPEDISQKIGISNRMVFNYINHLNLFFDNEDDKVSIKNKNYLINDKQVLLLKDFLSNKKYIPSPQERESSILFNLIIDGKLKVNKEKDISSKTFLSDLKNVEKELKKQNINLVKKDGHYTINGEPNNIRYLLMKLVWKNKQLILERGDETILKNKELFNDVVSKVEKKLSINFIDIHFDFLINYCSILLT
jgi:transcriptional antiterminator